MNTVFIYGLFDPRNLELRYIGKAKDLKDRLRNHIRLSKEGRYSHHHNYRWIRQLLRESLEPSIEILEEVSIEDWKQVEQAWIADCKSFGVRLTNMTKGGDSFPDGYIPYNKGGTIPDYQKEILRQVNTGKKVSLETKQKLRESHLGKKLSEEQKKKISQSGFGRVVSQETRDKISKARKGNVVISQEQRQRLREARLGTKLSDETKKKIAASGIGRKHTEESKKKMSQVQRELHLKKRTIEN